MQKIIRVFINAEKLYFLDSRKCLVQPKIYYVSIFLWFQFLFSLIWKFVIDDKAMI